MEPNKLFRTQEGCIYETPEEAFHQSVDEAAQTLLLSLISDEGRHSKDGEELVAASDSIKKAMATLTKALAGKLVTSYTKD
jgi:CRP-like cAMP-binding protein